MATLPVILHVANHPSHHPGMRDQFPILGRIRQIRSVVQCSMARGVRQEKDDQGCEDATKKSIICTLIQDFCSPQTR